MSAYGAPTRRRRPSPALSPEASRSARLVILFEITRTENVLRDAPLKLIPDAKNERSEPRSMRTSSAATSWSTGLGSSVSSSVRIPRSQGSERTGSGEVAENLEHQMARLPERLGMG